MDGPDINVTDNKPKPKPNPATDNHPKVDIQIAATIILSADTAALDIPKYGTSLSSGFDLTADIQEDIVIHPFLRKSDIGYSVNSESAEGKALSDVTSGGPNDLYTHIQKFFPPKKMSMSNVYKIPTGIKVAIPPGYELQIRSRSGLTVNNGIIVANAPGTIDSDYRSEICVLLTNIGVEPFTVQPKMRIAQAVLCPVVQANFVIVKEADLGKTARGEGGFGSTGLF
jgi:deoxyuridine 5'-triphosphate nucleotidohydrolase